MIVAFRHSAYDTPWRIIPSDRDGRFHRAFGDPTQYLCLHPLGPTAEMLRHNFTPANFDEGLTTLRLHLWAMIVDDAGIVRIDFENATEHGIAPADLVGEDYGTTQAWADRLRSTDTPGVVVPSAALPGTENLVLFGPRVLHPYLLEPFDLVEIKTGHLSPMASAAAEVVADVRWMGTPHPELSAWMATGSASTYLDPPVERTAS